MSNKRTKRAIVILYDGVETPSNVIGELVGVLTASQVTIPELVDTIQLDEVGIAENLTAKFVKKTQRDSNEAINEAIVFIGTKFKSLLKNCNGNYWPFAIDLHSAVCTAVMSSNEKDVALCNAVKILANLDPSELPPTISKKYSVGKNVLEIVKHVYNQFF